MRWLFATLLLVAPSMARADLSATITISTARSGGHFRLVTLPYSSMATTDCADATLLSFVAPCTQNPTGPATGDGVIDDTDVLCELIWTGTQAWTASVAQYIPADGCQWKTSTHRSVFCDLMGRCWNDGLDPHADMGFMMTKTTLAPSPDTVITFRGPCDPAFPGRWIQPEPTCPSQAEILHFPYNARYRTADEILCGEKNVDWFDADGNGRPDSCPNGLFDGVHSISVSTYDCDHAAQPATDHTWITRTVTRNAFGVFYLGPAFTLNAGEAYRVNFSPQQAPVFWNPPTDPCL